MNRIAVIGANGQVGAELCLLLAREPDVALVPVCRTRSGSAFLRAHGIAVRHGSCADAAQARALLGDCQVIVNSALASGTPRQIRATEDAIIENALAASAPGARVIHFSTQSVYGDANPGRRVRWLSPYGRAKLGTERSGVRRARRLGKELYILRLGHVGGALQGISEQMRSALATGEVLLPAGDTPSNLVYTVTLLEAIRLIASARVAPGIYDLMSHPQLGWRAVHEAEGAIAGLPSFVPRIVPQPAQVDPLRAMLRRGARLVSSAALRNALAKLLSHAPPRFNARAHAWWHRARARAEIAALARAERPAEHLSWIANGSRFIGGLSPTLELLAGAPYRDLLRTGREPWPEDLPPAFAQVPAAAPDRDPVTLTRTA
ncbi:MAG: NAD-dependent epimerase/dehydratase family protein [Pseudomonadota bacterium]